MAIVILLENPLERTVRWRTFIFHPDAGFSPSILWHSAAPIPRLANVQGRLGYNNSRLVLATVFRLPLILWKGAFLLNALFAIFVMNGVL
jgi:hypothetical protein